MGHEAVDLAAAAGLILDPWQRDEVCDICAVDQYGMWCSFETCSVCQRQDGKGAIIETIELGGLFLFGERLILHSAHEYKTAQEAFLRISALIDGCPDLSRHVKAIREANGEQQVILMRGCCPLHPRTETEHRLRFVARSKGSGRGFTAPRNILDEAYALTRIQLAALLPTVSAMPNPQVNLFSTVPDPETMPEPEEAVLPGVRKRAQRAEPGRLCYRDYSVLREEIPEGDPAADPVVAEAYVELAYLCNPALGIRISEEYVRSELAALGAAKFLVERLGLWPEDGGPQWRVISKPDWENAADPDSQARDPVVFAMATSWERTHTAIAAVGQRADGHLHGVIVEHRVHGDWPVPRMVELALKWRPAGIVIDGAGATNSMTEQLNNALKSAEAMDPAGDYLEVTTLTGREAAAGWGMVYDALSSRPREQPDEALAGRRLYWRSDMYADALTTSVRQGTKRSLGEGFAWELKTAVDMSPIKAVTDAVYGFVTRAPDPVGPWAL